MGKNKACLKILFATLILFVASMITAGVLAGCGSYGKPYAQESASGTETIPVESKEGQPDIDAVKRFKIYIDDSIPVEVEYMINRQLVKSGRQYKKENPSFGGFDSVFEKNIAEISFELALYDEGNTGNNSKKLYGSLFYAPVVSFYSLVEDISWDDFTGIWDGSKSIIADIEGNEIIPELVISREIRRVLTSLLGECRAENVTMIESKDIPGALASMENAVSVVAFEDIDKSCKVVKINGKSILDSDASISNYPLVAGIEIKFPNAPFNDELKDATAESFDSNLITNMDPGEIVTISMTGVTALTRQVAEKMDQKGLLYPAEKISHILLDADITHISNEVSFVEDCYAAKPNTMVFCSKPEYLELIKFIDADIIELTGNHLNDYGTKWLDYTIDIYDREQIPYFGGGKNISDAQKPRIFIINGYKFAFLGANSFGPSSDWATADSAGSAPINSLDEESREKDMQKYVSMVQSLKSRGYNVIFTFQYLETYNYSPTEQQVADFERLSDAGAVVVSGSQAHQPQGFEIRNDGVINFGLGNLFFGQALGIEVKQGLIAKHIFYRGKLINTVLITTLIEDFSQPRPTEGQERADLLKAVYNGSIK